MAKIDDKIGPYTLEKFLGSGGFGEVWLADNPQDLLYQKVAIKLAKSEDITLEMIKFEALLWRSVSGNENIIPFIEAKNYDGQIVIVSEFADGGSLQDYLNKNGGKIEIQEVESILRDILKGIEFLHSKEIGHFDLKPANILIKEGKFCLADFGLSKVLMTENTSRGAGTLSYSPPELFNKKRCLQSDIWSVGVILQKMLTGSLPFKGDTQHSLMFSIIQDKPQPLPNEIPPLYQNLISKCLQKDTKDRFQSANEMCQALSAKAHPIKKSIIEKSINDTIDDNSVIQPSPNLIKTDSNLVIPAPKSERKGNGWVDLIANVELAKLEPKPIKNEAELKEHYDLLLQKANKVGFQLTEKPVMNQDWLDNFEKQILKAKRQKWAEDWRKERSKETKKEYLFFGSIILSLIIISILLIFMTFPDYFSRFINFVSNTSSNSPTTSNSGNSPTNANKPAKIGANAKNTAINTMGNATTNKLVNISSSNSSGIEFVKIPSGSFMMGSNDGDADEKPEHQVTISKNFYLGKYEVTQAQWKAVMGNNPSHFKSENLPVENVNWFDVQEFIKKLNDKGEGTYRLPTEAEWEYACRAGTTGNYYGELDKIAWYTQNSGSKTHEVGTKQANDFGLHDMTGNVWEWTQDSYGKYQSGSITNPTGSSGDLQYVFRGGSYKGTFVLFLRSANRHYDSPSFSDNNLGFRLVKSDS